MSYFQNKKEKMSIWWFETREQRARILRFVKGHAHYAGVAVAGFIFFCAYLWFGVYQPSVFFPVKKIVTIPDGVTLTEAAHILKGEQAIRNITAFKIYVHLTDEDRNIMAGDYYFDEPLTIDEVAGRVTNGLFGLEPLKVVIPEGATTYQMAEILDNEFERFDPEMFMLLATEKEGYLFPDTYQFLPNVSTAEILQTMERTFYERLRTIEEKIAMFGRPVHEIVTIASLLEKEAWDHDEREVIAGVLWKRIEINMPLQVDAVFGFIEKTETFSPLFSDLEVESDYNTYKNKGLPPGPIGSPSLSALDAAVSPVPTDALFYLHGRDGSLHTALTHDEHLVNRRRYLD